jgi:phosphatidylglycerophosphatase A
MFDPLMVLATGFGLGLAPWASGTFGSLLGVPLAWWLLGRSRSVQLALTLAMLLAALPVCHLAEEALGAKDDGRIVLDEIVAYPLVTLGLAALVVLVVEAGGRTAPVFLLTGAIGAVLVLQIVLIEPDGVAPGGVLAQLLVVAVVSGREAAEAVQEVRSAGAVALGAVSVVGRPEEPTSEAWSLVARTGSRGGGDSGRRDDPGGAGT